MFLDLLGLGIIIPILPALILDPMGGVLPFWCAFSTRTLLYGFLIASYPFAQFFGAPILGTLADNKGRKKLLLLSLLGTVIGYLILIYGIISKNIYLLFLGRIIDGFTGGNISIAQSSIADISNEKTKSKNFGLIGMAFGLGFVIGPYIGGKLSDPSIVSWFSYATPFYLSIFLATLNVILVFFNFEETIECRRKVKVNIFSGFVNLRKAFKYSNMRVMFLVMFLLTIGFNFFTQFFQVFLIHKFRFTQSQIADFFAYMGIWIAFAQGFVLRLISNKLTSEKILSFSLLFLALTLPILTFVDKRICLFLVIPFISIFQGLNQPNGIAIISNLSKKEKQGEILGINRSISALAQTIPPIIAGFVSSININFPIWFAGGSTLIAWAIFEMFFVVDNKSKNYRSYSSKF